MNITFLGAAKSVTGSNFLVEGAGKRFLVDCGMYQGKEVLERENEEPFMFDVSTIDFMLLTHAHIDHSGRIPKLYNEGYNCTISDEEGISNVEPDFEIGKTSHLYITQKNSIQGYK